MSNSSTSEVWRKLLSNGDVAVVLLNLGDSPTSITARWSDVGLPPHLPINVRDLWQRKYVAVGVRDKSCPASFDFGGTNNFLQGTARLKCFSLQNEVSKVEIGSSDS